MRNKKRSKAKRWIPSSIITLIVLGIIVVIFFRRQSTVYESVTAQTGDITTYYSFSGNIEAKNRQTIMAEKPMQLSEIEVKEGDLVEEGDILMKSSTGDEITAPISGEIVNLDIEENAQVMSGIKLLDIVDYNNLQIDVKVDEYDLSAVELDKETLVSIGAINKELKGTISNLSKEGHIQNGITYFMATIALEPDEGLKVGMSAEVKLISEQVIGVITLPMSMIQFDDDNNAYVLKADESGNGIKTDITVGINDGIAAEIKTGITTGDTIYDPGTEETTTGFGFGMGRRSQTNGGTD